VVQDPLARAQAIVVLGGHMPFRAVEAALIYRQGWAPEIWLTRGDHTTEEAVIKQLGIQVTWEESYSRQILVRLQVPGGAIRLLSERARNTAEEVRSIARELNRIGGERVILVTSKPHSRRVRETWRAIVGEFPYAVVRYAGDDPYKPDLWWRNTSDALAVSREILGLLNVWSGFLVQPHGGLGNG